MVKKSRIFIGLAVLVAIGAAGWMSSLGRRTSMAKDVRQQLTKFSTPDLRPKISELEAKVAGKESGLDKAALALLYVKQAKLTGDVAWYDKAESMARVSLEEQPRSNSGAKLALSETLEKRHLFAQSMAVAKELIQEEPRNPEALAAYATVSLAVGEIDEASRAVDTAVALHPATPILTLRALVLTARGRDAEADFSFRKALSVEEPNDAPHAGYTRAVYARFLITKGRYEEARRYVDESLQIVPGQHLALSISGDLNLKMKQAEKASKDFSDAFAASPQVSYLRKFSRAKRMLKDDRGADDAMREAQALAIKEIKSGVHAHPLELGYCLIAGKDPAGWLEAVRLATEELKVRHSVLPYVVMAQAHEKAGNWEAATEAINAVLRTGIRNPDYFVTAAKIAKGSNDIEKARLYFEAALAEDANLTEAQEGLKALPEAGVAKVVTR